MIDQTTQAILTVGMPTLAVLVGIPVNNSRLSDLRAYIDARFEAAHHELLRVEGVLDARLSHLESRR